MKMVFHTVDQGVFTFDVQQSSVLIGRGSSCDVILKVEGISRQHCRIDMSPKGDLTITDLGSTNGVIIDGQRIPINTPVPYAPYLGLVIGSIPQVTIETERVIKEEKETTMTRQIDITLDHPQKSRKIPRKELNKIETEVVTGVQAPVIVGVIIAVVLGFFYLFLDA